MIKKAEISQAKELAKKFPNFKPSLYYCFGTNATGIGWAESHSYSVRKDEWDVYDKGQNGYKWAKKRTAYFSKADLMGLLKIEPELDEESLIKKALT